MYHCGTNKQIGNHQARKTLRLAAVNIKTPLGRATRGAAINLNHGDFRLAVGPHSARRWNRK